MCAREVEQLLALLGLARGAQEQPAEQPEREQRLLHHHDRAGDVLVGQRRDALGGVAVRVEGVEDRARPQEQVAENGAGEAHGDHVQQPPEVCEPARHGQRAEQAHPHVDAEAQEHRVLERVHALVAQRRFVQRRDVPHVQVDGPQREGERGMREQAQAIE